MNNEQGQNFGTCQINTTNVVCTFSDVAEKLLNVRGHFYFQIEATQDVASGEKKTINTDLGTNLEAQKVTITGPTNNGGSSPGTFHSKGAVLNPKTPV